MTAKKSKITEDGVLTEDIKQLMTPTAIKELKDLSPTLQQFLLRWQDKRDLILTEQIKEELKDFFIDLTDSNTKIICDEITAHVCKQVGETLTPIYEALGKIAKGIDDIKKDISEIKLDIIDIKKRLEQLEDKVSEEERRIARLEKTQRWWNIGLRIAIAVAISAIVTLVMIHFLTNPLW
jgi:DNA repair ATPase RecN